MALFACALILPNLSFGFWDPFELKVAERAREILAAGGIVTRPTLAMIGEAGPEAVVPLDRMGGGMNVNVYVSGSVTSERDLVESIRRELINIGRRNGSALGGLA